LAEAVPLFEAASGNKVAVRFGLTREMKAAIEAGAVFDVALLPRSAIDQLMEGGKIAPGAVTDAVRSLVGLMVRTGTPEPDIATIDAFTTVLRQARSISFSKGPSGLYVAELLERLGLAAEMKDKTVFAIGRPVGEVVASGEAEIGMQQIIENQPVAGAHLVGPLPPELINYVMYSAGFALGAVGSLAAQAFVKFLASADAERIIRAKGMEPA
jgi:molybdate transport system substrate-binding protein